MKQAFHRFLQLRCGTIPEAKIKGHYLPFGHYCRQPGRGRTLLCGDAAGLVEPLMAEGIYNAIKSGQCAAGAINDELSGQALARESFAEQLSVVQADIKYCARWEARLYRHFDLWCDLLTTRPIRTALLEGYARGRTLSEIRKGWLSLLGGYLLRKCTKLQ